MKQSRKKYIATSINEFVKIEDDRQMEVNWFLVDAFKKTIEAGALEVVYEEKNATLHTDNIPDEYKIIIGFEEKMKDFTKEYNKLLKVNTYEQMEKLSVLSGFIYLTKPFIKKIEYKNV